MTVSISYPTPLGADECDSIIGGLVIKSYPYYLAEATLTCVASGKKLQDVFLKTSRIKQFYGKVLQSRIN